VRRAVVFLLRGYQALLSPLLPAACRFEPTCSRYAVEAVTRHGVFVGLWLAARRLGRCRPGGGGGDDPVPPRRSRG
jgi:putative membrane protein insertion efficiency factor